MNLWYVITLYSLCSTLGLLFMKRAFNVQKFALDSLWHTENLIHFLTGGNFLLGFTLYVLGFFIWLYILARHDLSLAFPVASGVLYLGLLIGSIFWLHEEVGMVRIAGVFLILAGIVLV